ncbi:VOC family protein [archaeon]|nr:MAG: VOC family protein [archaeon]
MFCVVSQGEKNSLNQCIPMALFNHIALRVSDLSRSKQFYVRYLGLAPQFEHPISGPQFETVTGIRGFDATFAVLSDEKNEVTIELVELSPPLDESPSSFNHIAFQVEDVDELYARLVHDGVKTISAPLTLVHGNEKIDGKRFFYFLDPDGNVIEAFNPKDDLYSSH